MAIRSVVLIVLALALGCPDASCSAFDGEGVAESGFGVSPLDGMGSSGSYVAPALPSGTPLIFYDACDMAGTGAHDACTNTGWTDGEVQSDVDPWIDTGGGGGYDLGTATVADQTEYDTTVAKLGGGSKSTGIFFDGSDQIFNVVNDPTPYNFMLSVSGDYTCVLAFAIDSMGAGQEIVHNGTLGADTTVRTSIDATKLINEAHSGASDHWNYTPVGSTFGYSLADDPQLVMWTYTGDDTTTDEEIRLYWNNMVSAIGSDELTNKPMPGTVTRRLRMGRDSNTATRYLSGWVHLYYCTDRILTSNERQAFKRYLELRLGVLF